MRFTKKDKYGHFYTNQANCRNIGSLDGKKLEGEYFENKTLAIDGKAIDKLGELEDIENELGVSLKTLFKVIEEQSAWTYYKGEYEESNIIEYMLGEDFIYFYFDSGKHLVFGLKEYGKTWALTKEELEK